MNPPLHNIEGRGANAGPKVFHMNERQHRLVYRVRESSVALSLAVAVLGLLGSCKATITESGPIEIVIKSDRLLLEWDPPSSAGLAADPANYRIYHREPGSSGWNLLADISATNEPSFHIGTDILAYGRYEFAVSAVDIDKHASTLHTSIDHTAYPTTGWYVNWIGSK